MTKVNLNKRIRGKDRMPMISIRLPQHVMNYFKQYPMHTQMMRQVLTDFVLTQSNNVIPVGDGKDT